MNWRNIDLNSHEREVNIVDPLSFDTLLLEISCNIRTENLNEAEISKAFEHRLICIADEAREIFRANLKNITKQAIKERVNK